MAEHASSLDDMDLTVRVVLTGKSPLVMHNIRTADPDDEYAVAVKQITDKRQSMTPEDRRRKEDLQWRGALYTETVKEDGELVERVTVPMIWLIRALEGGGKTLGSGTSSKGAAVIRSVAPTELYMLLQHDGPEDITALAADPRFRWRTIVNATPNGAKKSMVPSARPTFPAWSLTTTLSVVTYMGLSWEDFERTVKATGNIGIGDSRKLGFGRFSARLTKLR